ncbi:MAG: hypothetical protein R3335_07290 [Anaerolineales bacterium]|nr:hypothetical protein [Anaerolineales bacterium]
MSGLIPAEMIVIAVNGLFLVPALALGVGAAYAFVRLVELMFRGQQY